ncbi:MAG: Zn-dependent hydrolase, partial [Acidobacteria bacterium]|nr:Zn-dependent hydrolase [Acidobacteriota bacterium]
MSELATDLPERLAAWKRVDMPFHSDGLSKREIDMVNKLVDASHYLEDVYWRQNDPGGLKLFVTLENAKTPHDQMLRRYVMIMGGRYDLLDKNRPFVPADPMPPGRGFYPPDITREQIEAYVAAHPDKKAEIYSPHTVVHRDGSDLKGVPYHVEWNALLQKAAQGLRDASALSDDQQFAAFLKLRADALLSDDYFQSDLAWMDLKDPKFDIIFAPYETYDDGLLGIKTSYGGAVMIRNQAESANLKLYEKYVPDIQDALPLSKDDLPSKRGLQTPMEVMDTPFRAGDLRHGYQAVADNLPNDPRIHEQKGTKKIFFKNFMDA